MDERGESRVLGANPSDTRSNAADRDELRGGLELHAGTDERDHVAGPCLG